MTKEEPLLYTKDITKDYVSGKVVTHALKGASIEIKKGEFVSIMGHSGSGKSTLMHILGFLDNPTSGKYVFEGINTENLKEDELAEIRNKKIGFVFQTFNLLPRTSALDNVRLPLIYAGVKEKDQKKRATEALESVGLGHRINYMSNEISGGEQQRVAIARALVNEPSIILADEPTGNLDSNSTNEIMEIFEKLHKKGNTIVVVTHEDNVAEHAKRAIKMKDGECIKC